MWHYFDINMKEDLKPKSRRSACRKRIHTYVGLPPSRCENFLWKKLLCTRLPQVLLLCFTAFSCFYCNYFLRNCVMILLVLQIFCCILRKHCRLVSPAHALAFILQSSRSHALAHSPFSIWSVCVLWFILLFIKYLCTFCYSLLLRENSLKAS